MWSMAKNAMDFVFNAPHDGNDLQEGERVGVKDLTAYVEYTDNFGRKYWCETVTLDNKTTEGMVVAALVKAVNSPRPGKKS